MFSDEQVCFDRLGFELLMDTLKETFGSAGESMIFQMSKRYGSHLIKAVQDQFGGRSPEEYEEHVDRLLNRVNGLGWGSFSYGEMNWEKGEFIVNVDENAFRESCKQGRDSLCYFIRGIMVGAMEEATKRNLSIEELKCYKLGDDHCIFKMRNISP